MRDGFTAEQAGPRHRLVFLAIAVTLGIVGAITFVYADLALPSLPAFLPAYSSAVIGTDLITAYLIFGHAPLSGRSGLVLLAGAYLFSGTVVIGQMLVFPGVWSEQGLLGAGPQSAVWLWVFWHGGFPTLVIASTAAALWQRKLARPIRLTWRHNLAVAAFVVGLVVLLEWLVTAGHAWLPDLIVGGNYQTLTHSLPGRLVVILNLTALVAVALVTRGRAVLDLGLVIAMLASLIDAILTLRAGARFSLGWYVARASSVVSAFSVLAVYLREVTWLYARVIRLNARLEEQAAIDDTTGLFNRRYFNRQLDNMLRDARRRQESLSLLLIDVDHFKLYNDRYGHLAGDDCLRQVAEAIESAIRRPLDVATRYGGEEFAVILPTTGADGARHVAGLVLTAVTARKIEHGGSSTAPVVSVSVGAATAGPQSSLEEIIRNADRALYAAKDAGRNRAMSHDEL